MSIKFKNKRILVTGACGTIGKEIVRQMVELECYKPKEIIGLDNNESETFFMDQAYLEHKNAHFFVADIKHYDELARKFRDIDIVFHTAALKHVILSERSPEQAVESNIIGLQNVIGAAKLNNVEKVIFTSSDKAVNPTNVMGTSKLMGERLMTAANSNNRDIKPIFASTRFGNILGSSGSVVSIFHNQIMNGGPVTLTHQEMSRFIMSVEEAVELVIKSSLEAQGGEVFITKMPVVKIRDLAQAMIEILAPKYGFKIKDINIIEIGLKPGEKLYEELISTEEVRRSIELKDYFSVLPAFRGIYNNIDYEYKEFVASEVKREYRSDLENCLTINQIKEFLKNTKILNKKNNLFGKRYWPGDKEEII